MSKVLKYTLNVILGILCSLPVITIAAGITAVHFVNMKIYNGTDSGVIKEFFKSFKMNLLQSVVLTVIFAGLGYILGINWVKDLSDLDNINKVAVAILGILTFLFFIFESFSTYLLAKFDNSIGKLFLLTVFSIGAHIDVAAKMAFSIMLIIAATVLIVIVNPGVISFTVAAVFLLVALVCYEMLSIKWFAPVYTTLLKSKEISEQNASSEEPLQSTSVDTEEN